MTTVDENPTSAALWSMDRPVLVWMVDALHRPVQDRQRTVAVWESRPADAAAVDALFAFIHTAIRQTGHQADADSADAAFRMAQELHPDRNLESFRPMFHWVIGWGEDPGFGSSLLTISGLLTVAEAARHLVVPVMTTDEVLRFMFDWVDVS